jgi:hypothetical protein
MEPNNPAPVKSHKQSYELPDPIVNDIPPVLSFTDLSAFELKELKKMIMPFTIGLSPHHVQNTAFIAHQPKLSDFLLEQANEKRRVRLAEEHRALRNRRENFTRSFASLFASVGEPLQLSFTTAEGIQRYPVVYLEIKGAGKELHATVHRSGQTGDTQETYVLAAVNQSQLEFGIHIYRHRAEQTMLHISKKTWKATHPVAVGQQTLVGLAARCLAKDWSRFKPASKVAILERLGISQELTVQQEKLLQDEERRGSPSPPKEKKASSLSPPIELKNQGEKRKRAGPAEEEEEAVASDDDDDMSDFQRDPREFDDNRRLVKRRLFVDLVSEDEEDEKAEKKE